MTRELVLWIVIILLVAIASFECGILYEKSFNEFNQSSILNLKTRIEILEGLNKQEKKEMKK